MVVRLWDGSGFEVKSGSNVIISKDGKSVAWLSINNQPQAVDTTKVRQIEP